MFIYFKDSSNRQCKRKGGPTGSKQKGMSTVTPKAGAPGAVVAAGYRLSGP